VKKTLKSKTSAIFYSLSALFFGPYEPLWWCYERLINTEIISSIFVYRAGITVKNESSKQIFYVIVRGIKI
jgi:hypothetical protein